MPSSKKGRPKRLFFNLTSKDGSSASWSSSLCKPHTYQRDGHTLKYVQSCLKVRKKKRTAIMAIALHATRTTGL